MRTAILKAYSESTPVQVLALWLFTAVAFIVPLFVWPPAQDSFVLPKAVFLGAATWLLLGAVLAQSLHDRPFRIILHPVNGLLTLFVLWEGLSILWSSSPALATDQFTTHLLMLLFALMAQSLLTDDRRRLIALGLILVLSSVMTSIWALVVDFNSAFNPGSITVRQTLHDWRDFVSTASFGNTGHLADFIVMGFLAALAFFLTARRGAWFFMAALWIQSAALLVSWSVHSNASLIVAAIMLLALLAPARHAPWIRRRLKLAAPLVAGWLIIILFFVLDHPLNPHGSNVWAQQTAEVDSPSGGIFSQAFSSGRWKEGGPTRLAIWLTTLAMISDHTWLGTGAGNFTYVYPATESALLRASPDLAPYASLWTNAAHNELLQTWSETGVVGLLLLVATVAASFYYMLRRRQARNLGNNVILSTSIAMLTAFCLQAQMNFPLELPVSSHLFMILLGVPLVLPQRGTEADLLMPVRREFGPVRIGIQLKNMRVPTELHFGLNAPGGAATFVAVLLVAIAAVPAWRATAPLRSSVQYRPVYEGMREPGAFDDPQRLRLIEAQALRALETDSANTDCRSALSDLYVRTGQFEKALEQLPLVKRRLNALEVHVREAISLEQTGRVEEAAEVWNVVFTRRPEYGMQFPAQFQHWAISQRANGPAQ